MKRARLGVWIAVLSSASIGCSPDTADLFATGSDGNGGAGATTAKSSTSSAVPDTTTTTGATTGATNPDTTAATTSGPAQTVSAQASSSSGPVGTFVACGDAGQCDVDASNVCCWDSDAKEGDCTEADACALTATGQFVTAIACGGPGDCPGQICCATRYLNSADQPYETTECASQCQQPDVQLCDPSAPNICPNYFENGQQKQMVCKSSMLLPTGYFVCGRPNPP